MVRLLPKLGKALGFFELSVARNVAAKTQWTGRSVSTRPQDCSQKCEKFNPNKPCCLKNEDGDLNIITSPVHSWHPLNIWNFDDPKTSKTIKVVSEGMSSALKEMTASDSHSICDSDDD